MCDVFVSRDARNFKSFLRVICPHYPLNQQPHARQVADRLTIRAAGTKANAVAGHCLPAAKTSILQS